MLTDPFVLYEPHFWLVAVRGGGGWGLGVGAGLRSSFLGYGFQTGYFCREGIEPLLRVYAYPVSQPHT